MTVSAREEILGRMRAALAGVHGRTSPPRADEQPAPGDPPGLDRAEGRVALFVEQLERVGGHVHRPQARADVAATVCRIVREIGAGAVALSDSSELAAARAALEQQGVALCPAGDRAALLEADAGVSWTQWGIAETGTLVLVSSAERHRFVSLVPPVHVALVEETAILGTLGDSLRAVQGDSPDSTPATITLITGPSRTADIELTLVVGVHGPKELHVILIPSS